jgi:hypothetical protein
MAWILNDEDDNQLVEIFDCVLVKSPQIVRRGDEEVVVLRLGDYEALIGEKGFVDHLMSGSSFEDPDLTRTSVPVREGDLGEDSEPAWNLSDRPVVDSEEEH